MHPAPDAQARSLRRRRRGPVQPGRFRPGLWRQDGLQARGQAGHPGGRRARRLSARPAGRASCCQGRPMPAFFVVLHHAGGCHGTLLCELRRAQYNDPRQSTMIRGIATPPRRGHRCPQPAKAHHYEHSLHVPTPVAIPATPSPSCCTRPFCPGCMARSVSRFSLALYRVLQNANRSGS
ncbi:conserved hypothetical protein [Cupriavidus taiwanensis]|uniref:Uncharacterized protein n=1 Tax=Cupriavidus taiwanensis TaxID=164546 RepID=A0A375BRD6_9BURK|nr:conserved hypothetical protein [Cupriavidus taiwanensis]